MSAAPKTLIERLREYYGDSVEDDGLESVFDTVIREAADEIEGLTRDLQTARTLHKLAERDGAEWKLEVDRLRAALGELEEQLASALRSPYVDRLREIIGLALAGRPLCERHHDADRASISAMAPAAASLTATPSPPEGVEAAAGASIDGPFLVADNGSQGEHRYRTLVQGISRWTLDPQEALWFARQRDAQLYAAEDEDAWCILPVPRGAP